jgi:hypothetical protein
MKPILIVAMFFVWLGCAFGIDSGGSIKTEPSVVTGGWHEIDIEELDESLTGFVMDYLDGEHSFYTDATHKLTMLVVERCWTQLVQGRKFMLAYHVWCFFDENDFPTEIPIIGLLMLRRDSNGVLTVEKDYAHLELFGFIELMLTGENKEREPMSALLTRIITHTETKEEE